MSSSSEDGIGTEMTTPEELKWMHKFHWVLMATGEGAACRVVQGTNIIRELHDFSCCCGNADTCTDEARIGAVEDLKDKDQWGTDESGDLFQWSFDHECGHVCITRVDRMVADGPAEGIALKPICGCGHPYCDHWPESRDRYRLQRCSSLGCDCDLYAPVVADVPVEPAAPVAQNEKCSCGENICGECLSCSSDCGCVVCPKEQPVSCPTCASPIFVGATGKIVAHYNGAGDRCAANGHRYVSPKDSQPAPVVVRPEETRPFYENSECAICNAKLCNKKSFAIPAGLAGSKQIICESCAGQSQPAPVVVPEIEICRYCRKTWSGHHGHGLECYTGQTFTTRWSPDVEPEKLPTVVFSPDADLNKEACDLVERETGITDGYLWKHFQLGTLARTLRYQIKLAKRLINASKVIAKLTAQPAPLPSDQKETCECRKFCNCPAFSKPHCHFCRANMEGV